MWLVVHVILVAMAAPNSIREPASGATEHAAAEAEETQKSACYRSLVEDMFAKELTTKQKI